MLHWQLMPVLRGCHRDGSADAIWALRQYAMRRRHLANAIERTGVAIQARSHLHLSMQCPDADADNDTRPHINHRLKTGRSVTTSPLTLTLAQAEND